MLNLMKIIVKIISLQFILISAVYANICDDTQVVAQILKQAKIVKVEQALIDCKLDPVDNSNMIMAYAQWIAVKGNAEEGDYALNLFQLRHINLQFY